MIIRTALVSALAIFIAQTSTAQTPLAALTEDIAAGQTSATAATRAYQKRIRTIDKRGPTLNSVIAVNPDAIAQARALDRRRRDGAALGPLHGAPILIKDNIEVKELATTAGSLALADNRTGRDAPVTARLRASGAVILGVTNLSEWANFRSTRSISGWSAVGGLVKNPYALDRNACGSSSGSAAAVAAGLAAAAVGTETSGSIVCPASLNGIVGLKPTVGLVSRTGIVPISASMDGAGPMTLTVRDAALMLSVMAGSDPADPATANADANRRDYVAALSPDALKGKRLGIIRVGYGIQPETDALFDLALTALRAAGAETVTIDPAPDFSEATAGIPLILRTEFKAGVAAYLQTAAPAVKAKTLADLIAFNAANPDREMPLFKQEIFEQAEGAKGLDDPDYRAALEKSRRLAGPEGIDKLLADNKLDALVAITQSPAWVSDVAAATRSLGMGGFTGVPAVAGYPHLTVPMGMARGLPVGLSFIGSAWSEAELLAMGYAYEQRTQHRQPPRFLPSMNDAPETVRALQPAK